MRKIPVLVSFVLFMVLNVYLAWAHVSTAENRPDITVAVQAAAAKDCGCGYCAAKGCEPCHGKNCYYCAAKALVAQECGCGMCNAKGCQMCGPGCDVCKFHLAPVADYERNRQSGERR